MDLIEDLITIVLTLGGVFLAIPINVFCVEVLSAILLPRKYALAPTEQTTERRKVIAVLVPAHNESSGLTGTLNDIRNQLTRDDRLLVVADNCTDDTAEVASKCGAEVIERHDLSKRGKGYALHYGLQHLQQNPPEIVIMIDADCRLDGKALGELERRCSATGKPVQGLYLMTAPENSRVNHQVAEFAWRVRNWLRPLGLYSLALPCQLMGSGMAFPWETIRQVDLASGWIVEDLKLGIDLASNGHPAVFCPAARITSAFASSVTASDTQRARWERGHIKMISDIAPKLIYDALRYRDLKLCVLALDLAVPPLSLLTILVIGLLTASTLWALLGSSRLPFIVSATLTAEFLVTVSLAWLKCGRDVLSFSAVLSIAPYVFRKLGLYKMALFSKANSEWIRTDRSNRD